MVLSIRTVRTVTLKRWRGRAVGKEGIADRLRLLERTQQPSLPGSVLPSMPGIKRQFAWVVSILLVRLSRKRCPSVRCPARTCGRDRPASPGAGAAHQWITPGNRLTAEPTHFHVNALYARSPDRDAGCRCWRRRPIVEHGLQPARQTARAGLQAADCIPTRRGHTAVCRILNGGQVAIKLVNLLRKSSKTMIYHPFLQAAAPAQSSAHSGRSVAPGACVTTCALRQGIVTVAEQRFQRAGGAVALVFRSAHLPAQAVRQGQHLCLRL